MFIKNSERCQSEGANQLKRFIDQTREICPQVLNNENGSTIVVALILLALLTLLGVFSTNTCTTELSIVRNEAIYNRSFYRAEGAALEAAQKMEDENADQLRLATTTLAWLNDDTVDLTDTANWAGNCAQSDNVTDGANESTRFASISEGIASGASLTMTSPTQLYQYAVHGLYESTQNNARSHIVIGYRKRF
jgi:Tfp pilus assembly protein PilX